MIPKYVQKTYKCKRIPIHVKKIHMFYNDAHICKKDLYVLN